MMLPQSHHVVANVYSQTEYWNVVWEQNGKLLK